MSHQKCPYCFNMFRMEAIQRHQEICKVLLPHVINKTQCGKCLKKLKNLSALYCHFRIKHPEIVENVLTEQCSVCMHYVPSSRNTVHLRVCKKVIEFANLQDYSCKICQQSLIDQRNLYRHIENHLRKIEQPSKSMNTRQKKFVTSIGQNYTKIGESFQCSKCSVSLDSQDAMIGHLKLQKEVLRNTAKSNKEEKIIINAVNTGLSSEAVNVLKESVSQSENSEAKQIENWEATAVNCKTDWTKVKGTKSMHSCSSCFKKFPSWTIKKHEHVCKIVQPLIVNENQCRLCWKRCDNGLFTHFHINHPELVNITKKEQCPICSNHFSVQTFNERVGIGHLNLCRRVFNFANLENLSCKICQNQYDFQAKLYSHIHRKHPEEVDEYILSQEKPEKMIAVDKKSGIETFYTKLSDRYHCFKCNISCKCKGTFTDHLKIDHNKRLQNDLTFDEEEDDSSNEDENLVMFFTKDHKNIELPSEIVTVNNPQAENEENLEPMEKVNEKSDSYLEKSKKLKNLDKFANKDKISKSYINNIKAQKTLSKVAKIKSKLAKEERLCQERKPKKKLFTQGKARKGKTFISVCVHCLEPHSLQNIEKHEEICKIIQPYIINKNQCNICLKKLKKKGWLINHFRMAHPEVAQNLGKTKCPVCFNHFSIYKQDSHERSCKKYHRFAHLHNFSCKFCGNAYKSQCKVYSHIEQNHLQEVENHVSSQKYLLKEHVKNPNLFLKENISPSNEMYVECPEFENVESFHVDKEKKQEPEVENLMEIIDETKKKSNEMIIGEENHEPEIENQMEIINETKNQSNANGIVLGTFKCQLCSEVFASMQEIELHIEVFHKISNTHFMSKENFYSVTKQ